MDVRVLQCFLDYSPSSSLLVRTSTSSTSPNFPNRSFRSFWVIEWLNPPTYSRRIALYPLWHYHCTDNTHQGQPFNCQYIHPLWFQGFKGTTCSFTPEQFLYYIWKSPSSLFSFFICASLYIVKTDTFYIFILYLYLYWWLLTFALLTFSFLCFIMFIMTVIYQITKANSLTILFRFWG